MEKLFVKYFEGEMPPLEITDFLKKVKSDPELMKEFIRFQNSYSVTCLMPEEEDHVSGELDYNQFIYKKQLGKVRVYFLKSLAYAASILLFIVITWKTIDYKNGKLIETMAGRPNMISAPSGQRAMATLNDGTVVWLNAKSQLSYPFFLTNERNVQLAGEAFFEVSANPDVPFIVSIHGLKVTALGTKFNITAYPENNFVQVSLLEGSVSVQSQAGQTVLLEPNQQASYRDGRLEVSSLDRLDYFLWKDGVLSFIDDPLSNIIKKLELYYDVTIQVDDPAILTHLYTGKFRQQDGVDFILSVLQKIYPFHIEKKDNVYIIKKDSCL